MASTMMVVSDTSDSDSEEDIYILRHSQDIQARSATFNVRPVAIGGAPQISEQEQNGHLPKVNDDLKPSEVETYGSTKPSGMVRMEVAENVVHFSDFETIEVCQEYQERNVSYRNHGSINTDPTELNKTNAYKEKKKNTVWNLLLLGLVVFFQSIGLCLYYIDMTLLNVGDIKTQSVSYVILLFFTLLSTIISWTLINSLGPKWTVFIGCLGGAVFTFARFFASMAFMVPAAILCGSATGPLLVAILSYMLRLAREYSSFGGKDENDVICYFNAFISTCTLLAPTFAALLRYIFLWSEVPKSFQDTATSPCMKDFCWTKAFGLAIYEQEEHNARIAADDFLLQALLGCFLVCSLGAAFLIWLHTTEDVLPSSPSGDHENRNHLCPPCECRCYKGEFDKTWLTDPMKRFCDANMMLLMPLCVYLGVQQYFMYSVFLQTYSQCSSQIFHSLIMAINLSLVASGCSMATAPIITHFGKVKVILPAMGVQLLLLIVMAAVGDMGLPAQYVITAFWAAADSILHNAIIAIHVDVFNNNIESTLVCLRFCQVTGYLLITTLQLAHVCNEVIIIFLICVLSLAGVCYVSMEIKTGLERREWRTRGGHYVPLLRDPSWLPDVNPVEVCRERTSSLSSRVPTFE